MGVKSIRRLSFIVVIILLLVPVIGLVSCSNSTSSLSGEVVDMMKRVSPDIDVFRFFNIAAIRADGDLKDFYNYLDESFNVRFVRFSEINYLAVGDEARLVNGDFNLDEIREELMDNNFNIKVFNGEYRDVELWESEYYYVALISSDLIILGISEDDVLGCIRIIGDGDDSSYDNSAFKEVADRLPNGVSGGCMKDAFLEDNTYNGLELWGISSNKRGKYIVTSTFILKFEYENDAYDAMTDIQNDMEDSKDNFKNIQIIQDNEYVKVIAEQDMEDFVGENQDEAASVEQNSLQLAVVAAMAEVLVGELDAGGMINSSACTVTYDGGTPLPVADYIVGGLESLTYSYSVATDGQVSATSGPLAP